MPTEKRTIFNTPRGYVKYLDGAGTWRSPANVGYTPNKDEAKQFPLGRSTSLAQGKLGRAIGWKNVTSEEIEVEIAAPEAIPTATPTQMQNAVKLFEHILAQLRGDFRKRQFAYYDGIVEKFSTAWNANTEPKNWQRIDKFIDEVFPGGFPDPNRKRFIHHDLLTIPDGRNYQLATPAQIKTVVKKRVDEDEEQMFQAFITKQTEKVAAIIKNRGYEAEGKVGLDLTGTVNFKLSDNSTFTMKFQIVWKTSPLGNPFWQFPTTFHNAIKADGTRVAPASEAKMKKEF